MREAIDVSRSEYKTAAKLKRICTQFVLAVSSGFGALASDGVVAAKKMKQRCRSQSHGSIGFSVFVDQQREVDAGVFAEYAGLVRVAKTDGGEVRAPLLELWLIFAQLRDVLATEDSTVVTQEDNHCWAVGP